MSSSKLPQHYPNETNRLLLSSTNSNSSSHHHYNDAATPDGVDIVTLERKKFSKWHTQTILTVAMILLVLVAGFNLVWDDWFQNPNVIEHRLVGNFKRVAEQSIKLLNNLTLNASAKTTTTTSTTAAATTANVIPNGCESTVLIMRHCEDLGGHIKYDDGSSHCSYLGFQRSMYLASLFGNATGDDDDDDDDDDNGGHHDHPARWPLPTKLFGMWNRKGTNQRQYELLKPLSDKSGVPIQMVPFDTASQDVRTEMFNVLSRGQFCDQVAVVAWKHKYIRTLAAVLGCDQERGCPGGSTFAWDDYDFDTVWEVQYVYKPEALRAYPQNESVTIHHRKHNPELLSDGWKVFGSVTHENFDALEYKSQFYADKDKDWMDQP